MVNILKTSFRMLKRGFKMDSEQSQYTKLAGLAAEYCYSINEGLHVAELLRSLVPEDRFETSNNEQWYPLLAQLGGRFLAEQVHINQEDAWKTWYVSKSLLIATSDHRLGWLHLCHTPQPTHSSRTD